MPPRKVQLIISIDDKDVDGTIKKVRQLGQSVATIKNGKLVVDKSDIERAQRSVESLGTAIGTAVGNLASQALSSFSRELVTSVRAVIDYSSQLEQAKIGFETMTGSADMATKHLKELQDFARTTPFQFGDLVLASQQLQGVGFAAEDIIPLLTDVGNALSAAGRMSDLSFAIKALGDIKAKGQLAGQEIIQLANSGIPIRQVLAQDLKVTTAELMKMGEKGEISADQVFAALHHMSTERFGGAMEKQSHTFMGAWSNIHDAIMQSASTMFKPVYEAISHFGDDVSVSLSEQQTKTKDASASFGFAIGEAIGDGYRRGIMSKGGLLKTLNEFNPANPLVGLQIGWGMQKGAASFDPTAMVGGRKMELDPVTFTLKEITSEVSKTKTTVDGIASLRKKLDADAAADQLKSVKSTIYDISSQLAFYGQKSQVAATKQKLINDGIVDFTRGLGLEAIQLAGTLDNVEAIQNAAKKHSEELDKLREHLSDLRADALFDMKFPKATELDRFDRWVKENAKNFRELASEIDATRTSIKNAQEIAGTRETSSAIKTVLDDLKELLAGDSIDKFDAKLREIAKQFGKAGLKDRLGMDVSPDEFSTQVQGYVAAYETFVSEVGSQASVDQLAKAREAFRGFLLSMTDDNGLGFFGDKTEVDDFIASIFKVKDALLKVRETATSKERTSLTTEIADLKDLLAHGAENDGYIIELAHLQDVLDLRNRERDAIIAINRAQLELAHSMEISNNQIRAGVYEHLAAASNLNNAIVSGINNTFDAISSQMDKQLDKLNDWSHGMLSFITEPLKAIAHKQLSNIFSGLLDSIFPGAGLGDLANQTNNPVASPIVDKLKTTNDLLSQLVRATGQVPAAGAGIGGLLGGLLGIGGSGSGGGPGTIFGGSAGGGIYNLGGGGGGGGLVLDTGNLPGAPGSPSNPNGGFLGRLGNIFSSRPGGIFAPPTNPITGQPMSQLTGYLSGAGSLAQLAGGLIGGRAGGFLSSIGGGISLGAQIGSIIPGIGTVIGAAIGGIAGFFASLFGGDPKKKRDRDEKIPALTKGFTDAFTELNSILADIRALRIDPDEAVSRATAVRNQIATGFGIQFESKKYQKESQQQIATRLTEADRIINEIKSDAAIARGAADRTKRILPEFAGGTYFADFFRPNGLVPGMFDGRDDIMAMISRGEMVLNPAQQNRVRSIAGGDVFAHAGIPNYPRASTSPRLATGGIAGSGLALAAQPTNITVQPRFTLVLQGDVFDERASAYLQGDDGRRVQAKVTKQLKLSGDI